jgi:hypothetical protein
VLVSDNPNDLIDVRFPGLFHGNERGFVPVYRVQGLALERVSRETPRTGGVTP